MLRNGCFDFQSRNFAKLTGPALSALLALAVGGCSADVLRFDPQELGYRSTADGSGAKPNPPNQSFYDETSPPTRSDNGPGYVGAPPVASGPATTGNVAKSQLPATEPRERQPAYTPSYAPPRQRTGTALLPQTTRQPPARPSYRSYETDDKPESIVVRQGDTLYGLSRRYGIPVADIKSANGLTNNLIKPGQRLVLRDDRAPETRTRTRSPLNPRPDGQRRRAVTAPLPSSDDEYETYTIRPGDSLYNISRRSGVRVATLKDLNNITDVRALRPGTVLKLRPRQTEDVRPPRLEPRTTALTTEPKLRYGAPGLRTAPSTSKAPRILNPAPNRGVRSVHIPVTETRARTEKPVATPPPLTVAAGKFRWPVRGRIIHGFGNRPDGTKNDGVDIAVPIGTEVHAAETGVVAYAGDELKQYGNLVLIRHENGWVSAYAHNDKVLVKRGDTVHRGQVIARAGKTGEVNQPVVHFELRKGAKPINPLPHLAML